MAFQHVLDYLSIQTQCKLTRADSLAPNCIQNVGITVVMAVRSQCMGSTDGSKIPFQAYDHLAFLKYPICIYIISYFVKCYTSYFKIQVLIKFKYVIEPMIKCNVLGMITQKWRTRSTSRTYTSYNITGDGSSIQQCRPTSIIYGDCPN